MVSVSCVCWAGDGRLWRCLIQAGGWGGLTTERFPRARGHEHREVMDGKGLARMKGFGWCKAMKRGWQTVLDRGRTNVKTVAAHALVLLGRLLCHLIL